MAGYSDLLIGNGHMGIDWSRDWWRNVTLKGKVATPIHLEANISKSAEDIEALFQGSQIGR